MPHRSFWRVPLMRAAFLSAASVVAFSAAAQVVMTTPNLLTNPGAETGSLSGWTILSGPSFTVPSVDTGTYDIGLNPHTGTYQFVGDHYPGGGGAQGYLYQNVNVSAWSPGIDNGAGKALVGFWEQSYDQGSASDYAHIMLTFLGTGGTVLGSATTPDFSSRSAWTNFNGSYSIPVGTRSITYMMSFFRANNGGTYIDSFLDDNSLAVSVPEVAPAAGVAGAMLAGGACLRRWRLRSGGKHA